MCGRCNSPVFSMKVTKEEPMKVQPARRSVEITEDALISMIQKEVDVKYPGWKIERSRFFVNEDTGGINFELIGDM